MKQLYKTSLAIYVLFLLWLVLFKFSSDPLSVLAHYQSRSFNLVPLVSNVHEMVSNFIVFIPLGLLLGINFRHVRLRQKLTGILLFSTAAEITQFVCAIGTTDITDIITNTAGGFFGLAIYDLARKYSDTKKLNVGIIVVLAVLLVIFTLLRFMVFKVRY